MHPVAAALILAESAERWSLLASWVSFLMFASDAFDDFADKRRRVKICVRRSGPPLCKGRWVSAANPEGLSIASEDMQLHINPAYIYLGNAWHCLFSIIIRIEDIPCAVLFRELPGLL